MCDGRHFGGGEEEKEEEYRKGRRGEKYTFAQPHPRVE